MRTPKRKSSLQALIKLQAQGDAVPAGSSAVFYGRIETVSTTRQHVLEDTIKAFPDSDGIEDRPG